MSSARYAMNVTPTMRKKTSCVRAKSQELVDEAHGRDRRVPAPPALGVHHRQRVSHCVVEPRGMGRERGQWGDGEGDRPDGAAPPRTQRERRNQREAGDPGEAGGERERHGRHVAAPVGEDEEPRREREEEALRVGHREHECVRRQHEVEDPAAGVVLAQAVAGQDVHPDEPHQEREVRDRDGRDSVADPHDLAGAPDRRRVEREERHVLAGVVAGVGDLQVVDRVPAGDRPEELGLPRL